MWNDLRGLDPEPSEELAYTENDYIGDKMGAINEMNEFRLAFQNMNGISLTEDGGDLSELTEDMKKAKVKIMCTAETKLCDKNRWVREIGYKAIKSAFNHSIWKLASSDRIYRC